MEWILNLLIRPLLVQINALTKYLYIIQQHLFEKTMTKSYFAFKRNIFTPKWLDFSLIPYKNKEKSPLRTRKKIHKKTKIHFKDPIHPEGPDPYSLIQFQAGREKLS